MVYCTIAIVLWLISDCLYVIATRKSDKQLWKINCKAYLSLHYALFVAFLFLTLLIETESVQVGSLCSVIGFETLFTITNLVVMDAIELKIKHAIIFCSVFVALMAAILNIYARKEILEHNFMSLVIVSLLCSFILLILIFLKALRPSIFVKKENDSNQD